MKNKPTIRLALFANNNFPASTVSLWKRFTALCLDLIPFLLFSAFLFHRIMLPSQDTAVIKEWQAIENRFTEAIATNNPGMLSAGSFTFSEDMQQFLETYGLLSFFLCFAYFSLSEIFLRGGTLGKLMFNITTAHSILGYPPPLGSILWRNAIKTLAIFSSSGIFLFFDILPFVLFPKRRMGHDWLSGTYAVTNKEAVTLLRKEDEKPTDDDFQI